MCIVLTTVRGVVEALGGVPAVAALFGVNETAIWNWVSWNKLPAKTYVLLHKRLAAINATAPDDLWKMAQEASAVAEEAGEAA